MNKRKIVNQTRLRSPPPEIVSFYGKKRLGSPTFYVLRARASMYLIFLQEIFLDIIIVRPLPDNR